MSKCPFATWYPGPGNKYGYATKRLSTKNGVIDHSAEGGLQGCLSVIDSSRQVSWHFTNDDSGLYQHYDTDAICWHAGYDANIRFVGVENTGKDREPLTENQRQNLLKLHRWLMEEGILTECKRQVDLWEHNEWMSTDCPSGRIPWDWLVKELKEEPVGDVFRPWRLMDIERGLVAIRAIAAWYGDLRHNPIEPIQNEQDRTRELGATLLHFYNERLADVPSVPNLTKRSGDWVHNALTTIPRFGNTVKRWPLDSTYYLPTAQQMAAIIAFDWTDRQKYVADRFDCEDFAFVFKARVSERWQLNNVGLVIDWSGGHGYNVVVLNDGTYFFFEPQNDKIVQIGSGLYECSRADILI